MNKLEICHLSKYYSLKTENKSVLKNINLRFVSGRRYAILGPSGCGKTTLLNIIASLDKEYEGSVRFNDFDLDSYSNEELYAYRNQELTYIRQHSINFERLDIDTNIRLASDKNYNLADLNLFCSGRKRVNKLSGGEKQRVGIIRSLISDAKIVVADEPTGSLDSENARLVIDTLSNFCKDKIFIFVTHDEELAKKYADEILIMKDGRIKKNFTRKASPVDYGPPTLQKHLSFKKSLLFSFKLMWSQKSKTLIFISSFIAGLLCLGFAISISVGFSSFFKHQIQEIAITDTIYVEKERGFITLDEDMRSILKETCPSLLLSYQYDELKTQPLVTLNDGEINLDSSAITASPILVQEHLPDNEIMLSYNDDGIDLLYTILETEDIDDFIKDENVSLTISIDDIYKTYNVIDLIYDPSIPNFSILHSNYLWNNLLLGDAYPSTTVIINDELESVSDFLNNNQSYAFFTHKKGIEVKKVSAHIMSISAFDSLDNVVIPVYVDAAQFWLSGIPGSFQFNNLALYDANNELLEFPIYLDEKTPTLEVGRFPQIDSNDVVISKKLATALGLDMSCVDQELSGQYKSLPFSLTIAGISDNLDTFSFYQSIKWATSFYMEAFDVEPYLLPIDHYLILEDSEDIQATITELESWFPDYNIYSLVDDVYEALEGILNKLNIGFSILVGLNLLIAFASIMVLSNLELMDYDEQFILLKSCGFSYKDIRSIWFFLSLIRCSITVILATTFCYMSCQTINKVFAVLLNLEGELLISTSVIPIAMLLSTVSISSIVCLFNNHKLKKTFES